MNLNMRIKNIKCVKDLTFSFPLEPGIYAITGENGSGKSTLISCASSVFYQMPMTEYFGRPNNASIEFSLGNATRRWIFNGQKWDAESSEEKMKLNGFYEGSVIFGNRFKDTKLSIINILDQLSKNDLYEASIFVKENLGLILHNDKDSYKNLYVVKKQIADKMGLTRITFCSLSKNGELISQPRMSTGENLLLSILGSLEVLYNKRTKHNDGRPCIVFLDEIELALHSSALRRLILFLKDIAASIDLSIFFSTHSIELLREIKAQNIFYLSNLYNDSIMVTNPCYPAYATRNLYGDDGYGNDLVILVEDDLAKLIIEKILISKNITQNIRIKILPTGGWTNTISMAYDVTTSNLLQKGTRLAIILDQDIRDQVPVFLSKHKLFSGIKIDYLPIASLEKYLRSNLFLQINNELFSMLDTYLFQKRPLQEILSSYGRGVYEDDSDGKTLYGYLLNEVRSMRKDREDIVDLVVRFILENDSNSINKLTEYLKKKILD